MSDLISRSAFDEVLDELEGLKAHAAFTEGIMVARRELEQFPAVDAVEVVRCKDCRYKSLMRCCPYQIHGFKVTPDWYCPMGVKEDT